METISCKMFFTVLWRGVCQVLGWFFGLFGYKRNGKFAKCVWGLFAISCTLIVIVIAAAAVTALWNEVTRKQRYMENQEKHAAVEVSGFVKYVPDYDEGTDGYIINTMTGEKTLKGIAWIARPEGNDTLMCYSDGKMRGYFSNNTGKVIIQPQFKRAWVFSDGLASVVVDGKIKFIDGTGKVVIDKNMQYDGNREGLIFHGGYCILPDKDGNVAGLVDKTGNMVLPMEYSLIQHRKDYAYWAATKADTTTVYDKDMNKVMTTTGFVVLAQESIDVTMPDHTMCKYDYNGKLTHDFCIDNIRRLTFETDEVYYSQEENDDPSSNEVSLIDNYKIASAKLRAYTCGIYEGLMTAEGRVVTSPLYTDIEAIGEDTYLCTLDHEQKVLVDGSGKIVSTSPTKM